MKLLETMGDSGTVQKMLEAQVGSKELLPSLLGVTIKTLEYTRYSTVCAKSRVLFTARRHTVNTSCAGTATFCQGTGCLRSQIGGNLCSTSVTKTSRPEV